MIAILDILRRKGRVAGEVTIRRLPLHETYSVNLTLFRVPDAVSPPPFGGEPPASEYTDEVSVKAATEPEEKQLQFNILKPPGFYYVDVGIIAFIKCKGKMYAQVEHFMPMARPCEIKCGGLHPVDLIVDWPMTPVDELGSYCVIHPKR